MIDYELPLRGAPVAFFDVETTGTAATDRITEIGVVLIERLYETEPRLVVSQLVDPEMPIPWYTTKLNGIDDRAVRGKPTWDAVWPRVSQLLQEAVPGAYNASFDLRVLRQEADNVCSPLPVPTLEHTLDPMPIVRRVDGEVAKKKGGAKLVESCRRRNIRAGTHRAAEDAMATAKLFVRLIPEVYKAPALYAPQRPSIRQWIAWQRGAAGDGALPMAMPTKSLPVGADEAETARTQRGARLLWAVRGGQGHLRGMFLAWHRGVGGEWRWVSRPDSQARVYATEDEAARMAKQCGGELVFLESRARAS